MKYNITYSSSSVVFDLKANFYNKFTIIREIKIAELKRHRFTATRRAAILLSIVILRRGYFLLSTYELRFTIYGF